MDDCALAAHSEEDLWTLLNAFVHASHRFGFTVVLNKTEALYQSAKANAH